MKGGIEMKVQINYLEIPKCNYLYASGSNFLGYEKKLSKEKKKLIGAKLIWKRKKEKDNKKNADEFAIDFGKFVLQKYDGKLTVKELLEIYKKEKTK